MIDAAQSLTPVGDAAKPAGDGATPQASTRADRGGARVYVDQDGSGVFVYRLVDLATGRVLVELPRERAGELKDVAGYAAGALVSTSA